MSMIRCATCHNPIGDWSRQFIFLRACHVSLFGWLCCFSAYKQQNSSSTLYIFEISSFDIPRLSTSSRSVFSHPQSSSVQSQVFSSSSLLGFPSNFKMSEIVVSSSNSVDKAIDEYHDSNYSGSSSNSSSSSSSGNTTDKEYTSVFLEFLLRFFRNNLGQGQLLGMAPRRVFLCLLLQMKQKPCTVVLQAFLPRQMRGGLHHLRVGTKSQMTLTLG